MKLFTLYGWGRTLLLVAIVAIGAQTTQAQAQRPQNYTGNGGKGMSLTVYVPQSTGLAENQSYIPALVQGEFVSNFSNYSAISILDWERLDDIYTKLVDEAYDDKAEAKQDVVLGRLAPTSHFLTGNIIKTETGYNIKANITSTADKMTVATYSGTFSFAELDNLTGIRRASLELLQKVGVELTEKARQNLAGAKEAKQVSAQTALAKGVTAQRAGTEVAALSYYYQAASFNPALKEAVKRSSVMAANISSGNIGADLRNDIVWRKNWVEKLKETEELLYEMINATDPPYTLIYLTDIKTGNVNYQTETADLSINTYVDANRVWYAALGAAQAVSDGLEATKRKKDWGLADWPKKGVSNTNPFTAVKKYNIKVAFELINQQGRVIGNQIIEINPEFSVERIDCNPYTNTICELFIVKVIGDINIVTFKGIRANDISDNLTIRVATVNEAPPQQARFAITAMSAVVEKSSPFTDVRNGKKYNTVKIGGKMWMAENLNYQPKTGTSYCYRNDWYNEKDTSNCNKYGRLYDWYTAMQVCPIGWHLPSRGEWKYLVDLTGGDVAGKKLKSKSGWSDGWRKGSDGRSVKSDGNGSDDYGFSAKPGGWLDGRFEYAGSAGYWWTATESPDWGHNETAYVWYMDSSSDNMKEGEGDLYEGIKKTRGISVRCRED